MRVGGGRVAVEGDCAVSAAEVALPSGLVPGTNRRLAGEDMAAGASGLAAGTRIGAVHIGVPTAGGRTSLAVHRRIRVAVVPTRDELRPPGPALPPGCVHDTNRHAISAALRALGAEVDEVGIVPDRRGPVPGAGRAAARRQELIVFDRG